MVDILSIMCDERHVILCKVKLSQMYESFKMSGQNWGMINSNHSGKYF